MIPVIVIQANINFCTYISIIHRIGSTNVNSMKPHHYSDVIMGSIASQITSLMIVYSSVYSGADQRKYQSSASLAFVLGIHRWPVNSPHKGSVMRKMFPFDDVIMQYTQCSQLSQKCSQKTPLSSPIKVKGEIWVSVVSSNYDLYSASDVCNTI